MFGPETDVHSTQITPETDLLKIELLGDLVKKISLLTQRSVYILPKPHMIRTLLRIPLLGDFDKISLLGQRLMYIQPKPHPMLTLLKKTLVLGSETDVHSTKATPDADLVKNRVVGTEGDTDLVKKNSFLGQRLMYIQPKPHPMLTLLKIASLGQRVILTLLKKLVLGSETDVHST